MLSLQAISLIEPHIYSFNNLVVIGVEDSVGVRVISITKNKTFMCFWCKFRVMVRISNPAFSTEDFEITYIGFLISEEFIGSLFEEFLETYPIDGVTCSIIASGQKRGGILYSSSIVWAISTRVLFLRSTTPFC